MEQIHQNLVVHMSAQYEGLELPSELSLCLSWERTWHVGSGTLLGTEQNWVQINNLLLTNYLGLTEDLYLQFC